MICPLCRDGIAAPAFDEHLRKAHGLVSYRNVRRSFRETLETIFGELFTPRPSADAWQALEQLARDEHPGRAEPALADWLAAALADLPDDRREPITDALAPWPPSRRSSPPWRNNPASRARRGAGVFAPPEAGRRGLASVARSVARPHRAAVVADPHPRRAAARP